MEKAIPTIFDVAREAGVARATVDRVIYHRGGVSRKTVEKVQEVIERLGYKANPIASSLASHKKANFACLIPRFESGEYWDVACQGFLDGARSILSRFNLKDYDTQSPETVNLL